MLQKFICWFLFSSTLILPTVDSQNSLGASDDVTRIAITPVVPDELTDIPQSAKLVLINRLQVLANTYGFGGFSLQPQFVLVAKPTVVEKQVSATVPVVIRIELETSLFLADVVTKTVFSTVSVNMQGIGSTDLEAFRNAFRTLRISSSELADFMKSGREGIISYYNSRCDFILGKAEMLNGIGKSEEALLLLLGVPEVCKECFEKAIERSEKIYLSSLERQCQKLLQIARSKWSARPDRYGAIEASKFLAMVPPGTKCDNDAIELNNEIMSKMLELEDWERKKYEDERAMQMRIHKDSHEAQLLYLKTLRDVGIAIAENQPRVIYRGWLW